MSYDNSSKYIHSDSFKEYKYRADRVKAGKLSLARCKGTVAEVIRNKYGTIFTLVDRNFIFKTISQEQIVVGDVLDFNVIHENTQELYVHNFKDPNYNDILSS